MEKKFPNSDQLSAQLLVVGGGIAGITAALEAAEAGFEVVLVEREAFMGGRVSAMNKYFPKLCPPTCGLEINFRRLRQNPRIRFLTLTEVTKVSGERGSYEITLTQNPRFVNEKCTACGECEEVCEIEIPNAFNQNLNMRKAIYLPHEMAFPLRHTVHPDYAKDERMKKCVDACKYGAIDLDMKPKTYTVQAKSIIWATGWKPYDATKLENLGFGTCKNVVTNVMLERMAAVNGPTKGKILRPSDQKEVKSVAFVQCAGSRDENHLPYCSGVCCLASMKQASYVRELYPDAEITIFYIDIRAPGRLEDVYVKMQADGKLEFHRGKVAKVVEVPGSGNLLVKAENTLTGKLTQKEVELVVLATGMVPNVSDEPPPVKVEQDDWGFLVVDDKTGLVGAGTAVRPMEVSATVQDATGAVLKSIRK
ncbi:MAG: CoB--CoM heterodisulfide reductase iron-sulfur subunit A family protein [Planctomycetota bacterium]